MTEDIEVRIIENEDDIRLKQFRESEAWKEHQRQCDQARLVIEQHEKDLSRNVEEEKAREEIKHIEHIEQGANFSYDKGDDFHMGCLCGSTWVQDENGNITSSAKMGEEKKDYDVGTGTSSSSTYDTGSKPSGDIYGSSKSSGNIYK